MLRTARKALQAPALVVVATLRTTCHMLFRPLMRQSLSRKFSMMDRCGKTRDLLWSSTCWETTTPTTCRATTLWDPRCMNDSHKAFTSSTNTIKGNLKCYRLRLRRVLIGTPTTLRGHDLADTFPIRTTGTHTMSRMSTFMNSRYQADSRVNEATKKNDVGCEQKCVLRT